MPLSCAMAAERSNSETRWRRMRDMTPFGYTPRASFPQRILLNRRVAC